MTNQNSASAVQAQKPELPILWAPKRNDVRNGVSLWVNRERPRVIQPATATEKEKVTNPPHMIGTWSNNGVDTPVAAWISNGRNGTFVVLFERNKRNADGSYSNQRLGTGNAVNVEQLEPFPPSRTPYMVFVIAGKSYSAMASATAPDYMEELGFFPEVVDNFEVLLAARKAAKEAEQAPEPQSASRLRP